MTRDGHRAIDGIAKDAISVPNNPFSGVQDATSKVIAMGASRIGEILSVMLYTDGSGIGGTLTYEIWNKDPTDPTKVQESVNKIYSIDIVGIPAVASWVLGKNVFVPYVNSDETQLPQVYVKLKTSGALVAYNGRVAITVKEAGQ